MVLERGASVRSIAAMKHAPLLSWADCAPRLVAVAAGRAAADLVIRGGILVNVQSREVLPGWQVAVAEGRFAYVGPDASHCIGPGTEVLEAEGEYLIPGFCDGHMHIESGMLTPRPNSPPPSAAWR